MNGILDNEKSAELQRHVDIALSPFFDKALTVPLLAEITEAANRATREGLVKLSRHPLEYRALVIPDRSTVNIRFLRDTMAAPMGELEFEQWFNEPPENDDLHRVNCRSAGLVGHMMCGLCKCGFPRFTCGHPLDFEPELHRVDALASPA